MKVLLQADLKRSASLDKFILVREWLKEVDGNKVGTNRN